MRSKVSLFFLKRTQLVILSNETRNQKLFKYNPIMNSCKYEGLISKVPLLYISSHKHKEVLVSGSQISEAMEVKAEGREIGRDAAHGRSSRRVAALAVADEEIHSNEVNKDKEFNQDDPHLQVHYIFLPKLHHNQSSSSSFSSSSSSAAVCMQKPGWKRFLAHVGPGFLVSMAYLDPGNCKTFTKFSL